MIGYVSHVHFMRIVNLSMHVKNFLGPARQVTPVMTTTLQLSLHYKYKTLQLN